MVYYAIEPPTPWGNIKGKPYVTVSPKGIANGQSDIPNDGADFGPDTPGTKTSGIQEAIDYAIQAGAITIDNQEGFWNFKMVKLLPGLYIIDDNATITINNTTNTPRGLVIEGSSEDQYVCTIAKMNSLPSPIISFSSPRGSSNGSIPSGMLFRNFSVLYFGQSSNAKSGVTVVDLSINEAGGTMTRYENLQIFSINPINNIMLDVSGNEDSVIDNVLTRNVGVGYNSSITIPSLKAHMPDGDVKIYNGQHSGIDIEAQKVLISGTTIGTSAGTGIIWRPSTQDAVLHLSGVYFNGDLTRLITIQNPSSQYIQNGTSYIIAHGSFFSKIPVSNGDYMIDIQAGTLYAYFEGNTLVNNNTSYTLYLFNPANVGRLMHLSGYEHISNRPYLVNGVTLPSVGTPPVPASGSAIQNTTPYPVKVYISGGQVTQIQIIHNGNTTTVFSSSVAQPVYAIYDLDIGDEITLTYSTAPSWTWYDKWAPVTLSLPSSSTSGTTAGTVSMQATSYTPNYKKYVITFSGYENDTTTNQTINFPAPFTNYAIITGNNTGLTISASTTGITITSPNSTTTYSGIVIVEGY